MNGRKPSYLLGTVLTGFIAGASHAQLTEGFDSVTGEVGVAGAVTTPAGWFWRNNSDPASTTVTPWFQGNPAAFPAHSGATNSYAGCNFQRGAAGTVSDLSVWFGTPVVTLQAGQVIRFVTRDPSDVYPDRLQVRLSLAGASTNVGTAFTDVGDFTVLVLDINPKLQAAGYPSVWTEQVITLTSAQVPAPTSGRIAFRYFVEDGGPLGANSNYIGVDTFSLTTPTACAADINGDNVTDVNDLLLLVGSFGATGANAADLNGDLVVDVNDLLILVGDYNCGLP